MTYPDERTSRLGGEGLRVQPEYRQASGTPEGYPDEIAPITSYTPETQLALGSGTRALTTAELKGAFDDPDAGEPGRDRFGVHIAWEFVLLLAGVGMAFAVELSHHGALSTPHLRTLMVNTAVLGVLALGAGISVRAGAVNLAIGPIFALSALYYANHSNSGFYAAAGIAIGMSLAVGLAIALAVTALHVPGWAASLGAYFGILLWETHFPAVVVLTTHYDPAAHAYYWVGAFVVLALVGSVLGAIRPIRRGLGRFRSVADPADRRGSAAIVITGLALLGSALLAGAAGIAFTMQNGVAVQTDSFNFSGLAIGIVLLGGTSAYGRRGGILGTILATGLVGLCLDYVELHGWRGGEVMVIAVTLGVGVAVTRLVEAYGRPSRVVAVDPNESLSWLGRQQGSWARDGQPGAEEPAWVDESQEHWRAR